MEKVFTWVNPTLLGESLTVKGRRWKLSLQNFIHGQLFCCWTWQYLLLYLNYKGLAKLVFLTVWRKYNKNSTTLNIFYMFFFLNSASLAACNVPCLIPYKSSALQHSRLHSDFFTPHKGRESFWMKGCDCWGGMVTYSDAYIRKF